MEYPKSINTKRRSDNYDADHADPKSILIRAFGGNNVKEAMANAVASGHAVAKGSFIGGSRKAKEKRRDTLYVRIIPQIEKDLGRKLTNLEKLEIYKQGEKAWLKEQSKKAKIGAAIVATAAIGGAVIGAGAAAAGTGGAAATGGTGAGILAAGSTGASYLGKLQKAGQAVQKIAEISQTGQEILRGYKDFKIQQGQTNMPDPNIQIGQNVLTGQPAPLPTTTATGLAGIRWEYVALAVGALVVLSFLTK